MFSDEELKDMIPRMTIEYRVQEGFLSSGSFKKIPENAFGAHITTGFVIVNSKGQFEPAVEEYDLYVGHTFDVEKLLDSINNKVIESNSLKEDLKEFEKTGIKQIVLTKSGIVPFRYKDAVFPTYEEMAQAITKIDETFSSVNFSVQNSESQIIHR